MKQLLLLALVIVFSVSAIKLYTRHDADFRRLSAKEAKARLDSGDPLVLLDVRTREEFDSGHISGALCLPVESIGSEAPAELTDRNAEILIYCRSGRRSAEAAKKLTKLGYTNVCAFGGIQDWPYGTVTE